MTLSTFLNILGSCIGFMSAVFFSIGALFASPKDIYETTSMKWDVNQHWADSIAEQRADYIAGGLLLLLSFSLQLSANLVPLAAQPSPLQHFGYDIAEIVAVIAFLLVCSVLFRNANAKTTKEKLRQWRIEELAALEIKLGAGVD